MPLSLSLFLSLGFVDPQPRPAHPLDRRDPLHSGLSLHAAPRRRQRRLGAQDRRRRDGRLGRVRVPGERASGGNFKYISWQQLKSNVPLQVSYHDDIEKEMKMRVSLVVLGKCYFQNLQRLYLSAFIPMTHILP